jgi:hypothetical protein
LLLLILPSLLHQDKFIWELKKKNKKKELDPQKSLKKLLNKNKNKKRLEDNLKVIGRLA